MVDIFTILFAVIMLVAVARGGRIVRPMTALFLALLTGAWIWANLRDAGWKGEFGGDIPEGLDPVTEAMFYRGWPLAPFMFCLIYFNRFHAGPVAGWPLVFDGIVLFGLLSLTRLMCERGFHRQGKSTQSTEN
jgi:hypothetical protein